jgi:hypothetical protein
MSGQPVVRNVLCLTKEKQMSRMKTDGIGHALAIVRELGGVV